MFARSSCGARCSQQDNRQADIPEHEPHETAGDGREKAPGGGRDQATASRRLNTRMTRAVRRVDESIRQVLSEGVGRAEGPRIGFVTVTGVETTPDLRHARGLRVRVLGCRAQNACKRSLVLEAAHSVLQTRMARELRLKRTPQLTFEYDPSVERGVRMVQADR